MEIEVWMGDGDGVGHKKLVMRSLAGLVRLCEREPVHRAADI